ncbi:MAG: ABC transporter permease [Gorillibacterium sp.]|nr:ABC transporter permease [Gorillibacterium sp.]
MIWQTAKATWLRNQRSDLRAYPWSFAFGHIISGLYLVLLSYFAYHYWIQGQLNDSFARFAGTNDYLTYAVIGGLLSTLSVSMIMNVSRALITEHREGTLEVLLLAPAGRTGYFAGTAVQQLSRVVLEAIPAILAGFILGARLPHAHWLSVTVALFLYLVACFAMGLALGAVMLMTRDTYLVQNTLFAFTTLVCGFQFPTQYLPEPLQIIGKLFPLTDALHILRDSLLNGYSLVDQGYAITRILLLIILYSVAGSWWIRKTERRFFEKWQ